MSREIPTEKHPDHYALLWGMMRGAHGQPNGLRWAWVHEKYVEEDSETQDLILFCDEPRMIYGVIRCGDYDVAGRDDIKRIIRENYIAPPFDHKAGCVKPPFGHYGYDRKQRTTYLGWI